MRIAVLADIHGNSVALDAVLRDADALGADGYWVLGDLVAIGPEPGVVMDRLLGLPNAVFLRGNTDRYLITGEVPWPGVADVRADPHLAPLFAAIAASFAWTRGFMAAERRLDWLADLPLDIRHICADGTRVHAVHASPGTDDGEGIHPGTSNGRITDLLGDVAADVVIVAHTHEPLIRRVGSRIVANTGCVSNPRSPDLRASYMLLDDVSSGTVLTHRRVAYDHGAFAASVRRSGHPAADYIMRFQRGEEQGRPPHCDHTRLEEGSTIHVSLDAC